MKFKWKVEFEVDETWVADGFEMTEERAKLMIENSLPYSYPAEKKVKIISSPDYKKIQKVQGYK